MKEGRRRAILIETIDGEPATAHALAAHLSASGFVATATGMYLRGERAVEAEPPRPDDDADEDDED